MKTSQKKQIISDYVESKLNQPADRFGHFKFTRRNGKSYRLKFQKQVIRFEAKIGTRWSRLYSIPLKSVEVSKIYIDTIVKDYM